jgi:hypothetical protein
MMTQHIDCFPLLAAGGALCAASFSVQSIDNVPTDYWAYSHIETLSIRATGRELQT